MTTGNSNQLFGGSRWIADPRELPVHQVAEANLHLKYALASKINCSAANASSFFTQLALRGAQAAVAAPDTFVTVANLVGRGRLYTVILPANTGAPYTPTCRITRDGTVYTIAPSAPLAAVQRMIIGAVTGIPATTAGASTGPDLLYPNAYTDSGFNAAMVGGCYSPIDAGIITPDMIETYGMPFMQFEESCLIEFKTSLLASAAGDKIGGATFRMLP